MLFYLIFKTAFHTELFEITGVAVGVKLIQIGYRFTDPKPDQFEGKTACISLIYKVYWLV